MIGYSHDDGGRFWSGRIFKAEGDCVARALSILTRRSYRDVSRRLADANAAAGLEPTADKGILRDIEHRVFVEHGLVQVIQPKGPKLTWTGAYLRYGDCIVATKEHVAAIRGGKVRDTFDSRRTARGTERKALHIYVKADAKGLPPECPSGWEKLGRWIRAR